MCDVGIDAFHFGGTVSETQTRRPVGEVVSEIDLANAACFCFTGVANLARYCNTATAELVFQKGDSSISNFNRLG